MIAGLRALIGKTIPVATHEALRVSHVLGLAEDETFAGWYNWRGMTNPDVVVLGVLVGGPDNGADAGMAVDAKLSARSGKSQVMIDTLAQLFGPFQPLTNLVDSLLGKGASDTLVLRNGFHVVRGVATTIDTVAKSTRALRDPEFAAAWQSAQAVQRAQEPAPAPRVAAPRPAHRPRAASAAARVPRATAQQVAVSHTDRGSALLREMIWTLDRLRAHRVEMPEPKGVYVIGDVLSCDGLPGAPVPCILLGMHGTERVAQGVVSGTARMPDADELRAFLATVPGMANDMPERVLPAFRVVEGKSETLAVLGNRRTLPLDTR